MNHFQSGMQRGRDGGFIRTAADVCLICSFVLWGFIQWSIVAPTWGAGAPSDIALSLFRAGFALPLRVDWFQPRVVWIARGLALAPSGNADDDPGDRIGAL